MIQFQENGWTDGRTERQNGQILFHRTLPANAGGPVTFVRIVVEG